MHHLIYSHSLARLRRLPIDIDILSRAATVLDVGFRKQSESVTELQTHFEYLGNYRVLGS